jgi:hypothetical protein
MRWPTWAIVVVGMIVGGLALGAYQRPGARFNYGFGAEWACQTIPGADMICLKKDPAPAESTTTYVKPARP